MKSTLKTALFGTALAAMMLPAFAQTTPAPDPAQQNSSINSRKENQQDRIGNGIENGSLTSQEASRLEHKEAKLNREERNMRKADDGKLTAADRAKLDKQQGTLSKEIYNQKHDAQTANTQDPKNPVNKREENQQDRIAKGVENGSLTPGEASHLERHQTRINNEVAKDRAANGGSLTSEERQQVRSQENRQSHQIYKAKHNNHRQ